MIFSILYQVVKSMKTSWRKIGIFSNKNWKNEENWSRQRRGYARDCEWLCECNDALVHPTTLLHKHFTLRASYLPSIQFNTTVSIIVRKNIQYCTGLNNPSIQSLLFQVVKVLEFFSVHQHSLAVDSLAFKVLGLSNPFTMNQK